MLKEGRAVGAGTVVKVGGALAGDVAALEGLARDVAALDGPVVVVHGGGAEVTAWQERLGLEVRWEDGLRVTTPEGARITAMVLSGWTNKRIVSALLSAGTPAAGLSGEDGLLRAVRKDGGRLGEVGEIVEVRATALHALLGAGIVPVVSPVSRGPAGEPLNVNADEAAIALAGALGAERLLLCSDVPGVLVDGRVLPSLDIREAKALLATGAIHGGMAVKVRQALLAVAEGVEVSIGDGGLLRKGGLRTRLVAAGGGTGGGAGPDLGRPVSGGRSRTVVPAGALEAAC